MKPRIGAMRHMERALFGTQRFDHSKKAADPMLIIAVLLFNMHAEFQQSPDDNMMGNHERNNMLWEVFWFF